MVVARSGGGRSAGLEVVVGGGIGTAALVVVGSRLMANAVDGGRGRDVRAACSCGSTIAVFAVFGGMGIDMGIGLKLGCKICWP